MQVRVTCVSVQIFKSTNISHQYTKWYFHTHTCISFENLEPNTLSLLFTGDFLIEATAIIIPPLHLDHAGVLVRLKSNSPHAANGTYRPWASATGKEDIHQLDYQLTKQLIWSIKQTKTQQIWIRLQVAIYTPVPLVQYHFILKCRTEHG